MGLIAGWTVWAFRHPQLVDRIFTVILLALISVILIVSGRTRTKDLE